MNNILRTMLIASAGLPLTLSPLRADVITFDQLTSSGNAIQTGTVTTQGYNFTSPSFHIVDTPSQCSGGCVDDGSQYLAVVGSGLDSPVVVTNAAGKTFSVSGLDGAKLFLTPGGLNGDPNADTLNLLGTLTGGKTVTASLTLPTEGLFQTFNLSGFTGLTSLTISGIGGGDPDASWAVDNLVVTASSAVPEPATIFLMLSAFLATVTLRRLRSAHCLRPTQKSPSVHPAPQRHSEWRSAHHDRSTASAYSHAEPNAFEQVRRDYGWHKP